MSDELGDRMKMYEMAEAGRRLMPFLPALLRLDGKAFHTFTRNFDRPFDKTFSKMMVDLTKELVSFTSACIGYTQSDEITLVLYQDDTKTQLYFDGRIQKLCSVVAAYASVYFNSLLAKEILAVDTHHMPIFDCRAWNVPNKTEAANAILWREWDATKNSIQMVARHFYSHKEVENKNGKELQEMIFNKGVNWNNYSATFKRGTYIQRKVNNRPYTENELLVLPPKHQARTNPNLIVARKDILTVPMPPLSKVANREAVIFDGADPIQLSEPSNG